MKLQVMNVFTNSGIAKSTGKPYEMRRMGVIVPLVDIDRPTYQRHGSGFTVEELTIQDSAYESIKAWFDASIKNSLYLEAEFRTSFDRGQTVVLGLAVQPSGAAPFPKTGTTG